MCRAVEQLQMKTLARGRAEGEVRGEARGRLNAVCALIRKGRLTIEEAADEFDIPIETIQACLDGHEE